MSLLQVQRLGVDYAGVPALREVNFDVAEGSCLGLIGPNGAGKSTTLAAIMGAVRVVTGSVSLADRVLGTLPVERRVELGLALVPEGRRIFGSLSVEHNLLLGATPLRKRRQERLGHLRAQVYATFPQLAALKDRLAGTLSGGEAQMLAVGRALMSQPRVLLLDEPSLGLAPAVTEHLAEALTTLKRQGLTMVIVEQKLPLVLDVSDRIIVLRSGRAVLEADPETVRAMAPAALYFPQDKDSKGHEVV